MASKVHLNKRVRVGESHVAILKVQQVPPSENRPDGFKVNCALIDIELHKPVLILDNHKPFGYHFHIEPHIDHQKRESIKVNDPFEALDIFLQKAGEIAK